MLNSYPAILHKDTDGYWIEFPDLVGCQTCGETFEETIAYAQEALGLYLASLIEHSQPIPVPSKLFEPPSDNSSVTYIPVPGGVEI